MNNNSGPQRAANVFDTAVLPVIVSFKAQRVHHEILVAWHEIFHLGRRRSADDLQLRRQLVAIEIQREIVDVLAEWVLDFLANRHQAENNVSSN